MIGDQAAQLQAIGNMTVPELVDVRRGNEVDPAIPAYEDFGEGIEAGFGYLM